MSKYLMDSNPREREIKRDLLDPEMFNSETGLPIVTPPRGMITKRKFYVINDVSKEDYIISRNIENRNNKYEEFRPFHNNQLIHLDRIDTLNYYPIDMHKVLKLFLEYYGEGNLFVINGFLSAKITGVNAHSVGLAVDILAEDNTQAKKIANAAYATGIKNIVYGGNFNNGNGYVHIDICPEDKFSYGQGVYQGPWG